MSSSATCSMPALSSRALANPKALRRSSRQPAPQPRRPAAPSAQSQRSSALNRAYGSRAHNKRVTRLRDLVEISPDTWAQAPNPLDDKEQHIFLLGLAQADIFKQLLLDSQHFRVYSYSVQPNGQHAIRFLMGSPRMEGLDDVSRVTSAVVAKDAGLLRLVPDTGANTEVAEICFPLPSLEVPAPSSHSADPEVLRTERLVALAQALEAQVVEESCICLMEKGSDDRSTFSGSQRLNKYFTGMSPRDAGYLHRGTCTSSSPTAGALDAAKGMLARLWEGEAAADEVLMEEVRDRVEGLFCNGEGRMLVHPSGTDAETGPLLQALLHSRALAREVHADADAAHVVSIVACAGEVGSGTTEACKGAFFSKSVPLGGNTVKFGQDLPALHRLGRLEAVEMVAREAEAGGKPRADYDAAVAARARAVLDADPAAVVVVHTVAGSKTGLCLPSPSVQAQLRADYGDRVVSVLDACQMRHNPALIPTWLRDNGPVLMTSSKFYGGPSFGSGVFFPHAALDTMNLQLEAEAPETVAAIAEACASYLTQHDVGAILPRLHDAMPAGFCNVGLLLRWAAGLHEMDSLASAGAAAGGVPAVESAVRDWVAGVRALAQTHEPNLEYVPAVDYGGDWQLGGVNTIIACRLRTGPTERFLPASDLKKVYAMMFQDVSEFLTPDCTEEERAIAAKRFLLGQPVDIPDGAVLRTCLGAAQLTDLVSGEQSLEAMMLEDAALLAKLALMARQFDHLTSHTL